MILFGPVHLALLFATAFFAFLVCLLCRSNKSIYTPVRLAFGIGLAVSELFWWHFRYSHEGLRITNLPLQLCDVSLWATIFACLFLRPLLTEFAYFAGIAGAGMALITPDLWSPWPSYPAIYFFIAHGGIVTANLVLIYGGITTLRNHAVWRAFAMLLTFACLVGLFNWIFKTNYMYLCKKPASATLLDAFGPWPTYICVGFGLALAVYVILSLPLQRPNQLNYPSNQDSV